jgi:hypothetical protein
MKPYLGARCKISVGEPSVIESNATEHPHGVVFEDDGDTGYFYARDFTTKDAAVVDTLHIYSVEGVRDRHIPSVIRIVWSNDWSKSALLINDIPHAMFDFIKKAGYSIDNFPDADPETGWTHAPWYNKLKEYFYKEE